MSGTAQDDDFDGAEVFYDVLADFFAFFGGS